MITPGKGRSRPVVLVLGFIVIVLSLVFLGMHHRQPTVQPSPLHQR